MLSHVSNRVLYAYVEGSDLDLIEPAIYQELQQFVLQNEWSNEVPWVVNQKRPDDATLGPDDLPDWELGLNFELPKRISDKPESLESVKKIAVFLGKLAERHERSFVLGVGDNERRISEDIYWIESTKIEFVVIEKMISIFER